MDLKKGGEDDEDDGEEEEEDRNVKSNTLFDWGILSRNPFINNRTEMFTN